MRIVFDVVAAPYLRRTPRALESKLHVVERGQDGYVLAVADAVPLGETSAKSPNSVTIAAIFFFIQPI